MSASQDDRRAQIEEELARRRSELGTSERDQTGELSMADQHPADQGSELMDRERTLGRIDELEEELRELGGDGRREEDGVLGATGNPSALMEDENDTATPLDQVEASPPDLATIPMGSPDADEVRLAEDEDDAYEEADEVSGPAEIYTEGETFPAVGDADPDDERWRGRYRPEE